MRRFGRRISKIGICVIFAVGGVIAAGSRSVVCDAKEVITDLTLEAFASGVPLGSFANHNSWQSSLCCSRR